MLHSWKEWCAEGFVLFIDIMTLLNFRCEQTLLNPVHLLGRKSVITKITKMFQRKFNLEEYICFNKKGTTAPNKNNWNNPLHASYDWKLFQTNTDINRFNSSNTVSIPAKLQSGLVVQNDPCAYRAKLTGLTQT